jgi:DNA mismatch repair protein MutS2
MDQHTLELLEFHKVRELLAGYAATSLGKELARQMEPAGDVDRIRAALALVTEMTQALGDDLAPPFGGLSDIRLLIRRAAIGSMLTAPELLQVKDVLHCTGNMFRYRMRLDKRWVGLIDLLARVEDLGLVAKAIEGCVDTRGNVLDMASPELASVRQQIKLLDERIQHQIRRLFRDPELRKALRFTNATVSGDHYVLPVAVNYRHRVPGVVHRTSSTGDTVFIEPAAVSHLTSERAVLKNEEEKETHRILRRLTTEIGRIARPLQTAIEILAQLDLVYAKARLSLDYGMSAPDLNTAGRLWLRQARHPLLAHLFRMERASPPNGPPGGAPNEQPPREVVPIEVRLGMEFNLLVITGPNTGGKTVALKTIGLLSSMAQSGMHIPAAEGSQLPVFHHILADIGDEQSLEQSLSTFSAHMSRIGDILRLADAASLVLLDELGAGTDPTEGAALGRAILDELDKIGCRAMVTTHLGDLKTYAFSNPRTENAAVEFDVETLRPTYHVVIGQFGMSNAIRIARRLQLPKELLRRARFYLRRRQRRGGELTKLQQARELAEKARNEAMEAQLAAKQEREEYEQKLSALQRETEQSSALRQARCQLKPGDAVRVANMDHPGKIIRVDPQRMLAVVRAGLGQWEVPLEDVFPLTE